MYESIFVWHSGLVLFFFVCFVAKFKYLMSTNFPLKPIQTRYSCHFSRAFHTTKTPTLCNLAELNDGTKQKTLLQLSQLVILQVRRRLFLCVFTVFNAIPDHHRSTNLSKIQFNSVNIKRLFPFPISLFRAMQARISSKCDRLMCSFHSRVIFFIIGNCVSMVFFSFLSLFSLCCLRHSEKIQPNAICHSKKQKTMRVSSSEIRLRRP